MAAFYGVIYKEENSDYGIVFPDLDGCVSAASTLEVLANSAREALALHLEGMEKDSEPIPTPRSFHEIYEEVKKHDGFIAVSLVAIPLKMRRVRVNVSFTEHDLALIDTAAQNRNIDRSAFLASAARTVVREGL